MRGLSVISGQTFLGPAVTATMSSGGGGSWRGGEGHRVKIVSAAGLLITFTICQSDGERGGGGLVTTQMQLQYLSIFMYFFWSGNKLKENSSVFTQGKYTFSTDYRYILVPLLSSHRKHDTDTKDRKRTTEEKL
jgi:hypothetical protein